MVRVEGGSREIKLIRKFNLMYQILVQLATGSLLSKK